MTDYASIKNIKQRRLAFLDDTAKYYNSKNLAVDFFCVYSATKNSPGCAIGRHLFTDVCKLFDKNGAGSIISMEEEYYNMLPKWMQEMGKDFLNEIQTLHDELFWDENGLSPYEGKDRYEQIKSEFCK